MEIRGEATIEKVTDTGVFVDQNPELEFDLLVALPDREPYRVSRRLVVSQSVRHNLTAGRAVPVRVDSLDPARLSIG
jgi:hypothetical protein